jgi:hypothetical protein
VKLGARASRPLLFVPTAIASTAAIPNALSKADCALLCWKKAHGRRMNRSGKENAYQAFASCGQSMRKQRIICSHYVFTNHALTLGKVNHEWRIISGMEGIKRHLIEFFSAFDSTRQFDF